LPHTDVPVGRILALRPKAAVERFVGRLDIGRDGAAGLDAASLPTIRRTAAVLLLFAGRSMRTTVGVVRAAGMELR